MNYFEKSILINCSLERAFKFHSDTNNLKKITPEFIKVYIIKIELPVKQGSEIILDIIQFRLFKTKWKIQITEFIPYSLITDTQVKGPFKCWTHSHIFKNVNGKTLMTDTINYELPFGVLGKAADMLFVRRMINSQFEFRHDKTKTILENDN